MQTIQSTVILHKRDPFTSINTFLLNKQKKSVNTASAYKRDIELFFKTVRNKSIENLTEADLIVSLDDVTRYQTLLVDSGSYKNTSINRFLTSVGKLYKYLKANEYDVNPLVFEETDNLKDDSKNVGFISSDEAIVISTLALDDKDRGAEKRALILLALSTSIRKGAILDVKYEDILPHETKKGVYVITSDKLFDKGEMVEKEIGSSLYNMLLDLKNPKQENGKIFTLKYSGLNDMIKRLCKKAGFDTRRNVSFHSLKRAGVHLAYELGGLHAAQMQGGHKSSDTTSRYIDREKNIAGTALFENIPEDVFEDLTREELLEVLMSFGSGIGLQLRRKAKEVLENRTAK